MKLNFSLISIFCFIFFSTSLVVAEQKEYTFCRPNNMVSVYSYLAEEQGFFEAEGIKLKFETTTNAKLCNDLLIAGKAQFMNGGDGPFTYLSASKHPLRVVAFGGKNPEMAIFARKDLGILQPTDLAKKRIGYLPGTVSWLYLVRFVEKYHLNWNDLNLVSLQPPALTQALRGGAVDAIAIWEPWGANAISFLGDKIITFRESSLYSYRLLISTTESLLKEDPESVSKVLRAMIRAEKYLKSNSTPAITSLTKAISFPPNVLAKLWPDIEFNIVLQNEYIELLNNNFKLLQKYDPNFKDTALPDFKSLVDSTFLKKLDPNRVQEGW